jgi:hypothetical protein
VIFFAFAAPHSSCAAPSDYSDTASTSDSVTDNVLSEVADLEKGGKTAEALQTLVDAKDANVSATRIDSKIEQIVSSGLPVTMPRTLLAHLPVTLSDIPGQLGVAAVVMPYIASTAHEPQHDVPYPRVCYIYRPSHSDPEATIQIFCRVHYTVTEDADLALRTGRLLLLGRHVLMTQIHRAPFNDDDEPIDVWLCRDGTPGGEEWRNNLYFYDLETQRSSIEWIREILHEYSHLALPAVGGYTAPEYWANGYLGERLLVRWIQRTPDGPDLVQKVWGDFSGAQNFDRLLITPAVSLYAKVGPNKTWQARTDAKGMQYFIGQMLTVDDKYGAVTLGKVLGELPRFREARPSDVTVALKEIVPASKLPRVKEIQ